MVPSQRVEEGKALRRTPVNFSQLGIKGTRNLINRTTSTIQAVLFVTHQPEDAERIARSVVFLEDGRVAATGDASDFFSGSGPEAFRRYIGAGGRSRDVARKRT